MLLVQVWLEGHSRAQDHLLARAFVVSSALLSRRSLSLSQRASLSPSPLSPVSLSFLTSVFASLHASNFASGAGSLSEDLADFFDGRLFAALITFVTSGSPGDASSLGLDAQAALDAEKAWATCSGSPLFPLAACDGLTEGRAEARPPAGEGYAVVAVSGCALVDACMTKFRGHAEVAASSPGAGISADELSGLGWDASKALNESFLWTHCRDQSAVRAPSPSRPPHP